MGDVKLSGRTALVTGASSGIGRAIALGFAEQGATVGVNYRRNEEAAREVADWIGERGGQADLLQADVTDPDEVRRMLDRFATRFGRLDILVNNAGGSPRIVFADLSVDDWDAAIRTNLRSAFLCIKFALPFMERQGFGRIINVSSQLALKGDAGSAHYAAAKSGLLGLTRALAVELAGTGVTVNAIAPGPIETPGLAAAAPSDHWQRKLREIPLGRLGTLDELVPTAVLLAASPDGDYYTGQTFHPNGGEVMP